MHSMRRVTSPRTLRGTATRPRMHARRAAMSSMQRASRQKSNSPATCAPSSSTADSRSKRSSVRCSTNATPRRLAKSSAISDSAPGFCTFTATVAPAPPPGARSRALCTCAAAARERAQLPRPLLRGRCRACATLALPSGTGSNAANASSKERPSDASSRSRIARTCDSSMGGTCAAATGCIAQGGAAPQPRQRARQRTGRRVARGADARRVRRAARLRRAPRRAAARAQRTRRAGKSRRAPPGTGPP